LIRTSLPIPPAEQFRLRLELAARRTRRALEQRRRDLRLGTEDVVRPVAEPQRSLFHDNYLRVRWQEDLKRERSAYDEFYEHYDALVGLLCLAAHEGNNKKIESEYKERRAFFTARYPKIKSYIAAHLQTDETDTMPMLWGRRACDAFEAMFAPNTVENLLINDGGNLISRMMRTQNALMAWDNDIRKRENVTTA
jgi:hypothetical protein